MKKDILKPENQNLLLVIYYFDQVIIRLEAYHSENKAWTEQAVDALDLHPVIEKSQEDLTKWSVHDALEPLFQECVWVKQNVYSKECSIPQVLDGIGAIELIYQDIEPIFKAFDSSNLQQILLSAHKFNLASAMYLDGLKRAYGSLFAFVKMIAGIDLEKETMFGLLNVKPLRPGQPRKHERSIAILREKLTSDESFPVLTGNQNGKWNQIGELIGFKGNSDSTPYHDLVRKTIEKHFKTNEPELYSRLKSILKN